MSAKLYKLRSLAKGGAENPRELDLEFDGTRAFVVWDSISIGDYEVKARLEIDPKLLRKTGQTTCDYVYCGNLVLPRPEHN